MSAIMFEENAQRQVALILDPLFGERCIPLLRQMPVWLVDSVDNRRAADMVRREGRDGAMNELTTFPARGSELPVQACERMLPSLDEHHDGDSQRPAYNTLQVIGVGLDDISRSSFHAVGFDQFLPTDTGFIAIKRA